MKLREKLAMKILLIVAQMLLGFSSGDAKDQIKVIMRELDKKIDEKE